MSDRFHFLEIGDTPAKPIPPPPTSAPPAGAAGWKPLRLKTIEVIGERGERAGEFTAPTALATDQDGALYVADSLNHRVQRIGINGDVRVYGRVGQGAGELWEPQGIAVDPSGQFIFVAEQGNHRVQCFQVKSGQHRGTIGGFKGPTGLTFDPEGMLWIADTGNGRVLRLNVRSGQFVGGFDKSAGLTRPTQIACDPYANLYLADSVAQDVIRCNYTGHRLASLGEHRRIANPQQIAADSLGRIYVAEAGANRLHVFSLQGESLFVYDTIGKTYGTLRGPCGVALGPEGAIYVSDTLNHRIFRLVWE